MALRPLLLALLVLALGACQSRPRIELGDECELSNECAAPLVCRLGRCRDECRSNRDCRAGLVCLRQNGLGACELEGESCVLSSDCAADLVCLMGRCTNECVADVDCPPGARCLEEPGGGRGCRDVSMTECQHHSECGAIEICAPDGRCREQCITTRDCRDGTVCVGLEGMRVCAWPEPPVDAGLDAAADAGDDAGGDAGPVTVGPAPHPLLAAGERHTCVSRGGQLYCWGANDRGQLGDGASAVPILRPRSVPSLTGVTLLAAGGSSTCATDSRLYCWGENDHGQLGDGTTTARTSPRMIDGVGVPVWLSLAARYGCLLEASGGVRCWGDNSRGQLGDGTTMARLSAVPTAPLAGVPGDVATRGQHSCARLGDGRVQCWGDDSAGQVSGMAGGFVAEPHLVAGIVDAIEVVTGSNFSCARRFDGRVQCWGNNGLGQLGDGTYAARVAPVFVVDLPPAAELAAGADHACARTLDGDVYCWGNNLFGQAGQPAAVDRVGRPGRVGGVSMAVELAAGDLHTCARIVGDGLRCWGRNRDGQLGDGTTTDRYVPVPVEF